MDIGFDAGPKPSDAFYDRTAIKTLAETPQWRDLRPNYTNPSVLVPSELTTEQLLALLDAAAQGIVTNSVENLGTLTQISNPLEAEAKTAYLLKTTSGKTLIVLRAGYSNQAQIPSDSRVYCFEKGLGKDFWQYSDLRTYLALPTRGSRSGLFLQEYGGENALRNSHDPRMIISRNRVLSYARSKGLQPVESTYNELRHPRHYLLNRGPFAPPAVIDIPFEKIK